MAPSAAGVKAKYDADTLYKAFKYEGLQDKELKPSCSSVCLGLVHLGHVLDKVHHAA